MTSKTPYPSEAHPTTTYLGTDRRIRRERQEQPNVAVPWTDLLFSESNSVTSHEHAQETEWRTSVSSTPLFNTSILFSYYKTICKLIKWVSSVENNVANLSKWCLLRSWRGGLGETLTALAGTQVSSRTHSERFAAAYVQFQGGPTTLASWGICVHVHRGTHTCPLACTQFKMITVFKFMRNQKRHCDGIACNTKARQWAPPFLETFHF